MAVIAVLEQVERSEVLLRWAWDLARDRHESLIAIVIQRGRSVQVEERSLQPQENEDSSTVLDGVRSQIDTLLTSQRDRGEQSPVIIRTASGPSPVDLILDEGERLGATVMVVDAGQSEGKLRGGLAQQLFARAPCEVVALSGTHSSDHRRFLVPVRGGMHGNAALSLARTVARAREGTATALHVYSPTMDEGEAYGQRILSNACEELGLTDAQHLDCSVIAAKTVRDGIKQASSDHDVVILGASEKGPLSRSLFGSLSDLLSQDEQGSAMVIVRAEQPWQARFTAFFDRLAHYWVPQMDRDTRIGVYEQLESGSRWTFDFMVLMALSTSIAALGLIQSSAAVVIGAMLVAPLMTPLLGAGLALLQSNRILLRQASRAIGLGFCLALGIGFMVGLLSPIKILTSELAARGGPTLLDLGVALLAGMAAAYAYARPHLVAALPGVAIAAALVPPIATAGVALSFGELTTSLGAALLFGTNVVAIVLGATFAFYTMGLRGQQRLRAWSMRFLSALVGLLLILSIPLGIYLWQTVRSAPFGLENEIRDVVGSHPDFTLDGVVRRDDTLIVRLTGPDEPSAEMQRALVGAAREKLGWSTRLRTVTRLARLNDSEGTLDSEFRRIVEGHDGYRFMGTRSTQGGTEVYVAGPDGLFRPFMRALHRAAVSRGISSLQLVYQVARMGTAHDDLAKSLQETLDATPAYRLRSLDVQDNVLRIELDGPGNPTAEILDGLKRSARTKLRRPVALVVTTHLTSVLSTAP